MKEGIIALPMNTNRALDGLCQCLMDERQARQVQGTNSGLFYFKKKKRNKTKNTGKCWSKREPSVRGICLIYWLEPKYMSPDIVTD